MAVLNRVAVIVAESVRMEPLTKACGHADLEELGREGRALYYRCRPCGAVLVVQGDRVWLIQGSRPSLGDAENSPSPT